MSSRARDQTTITLISRTLTAHEFAHVIKLLPPINATGTLVTSSRTRDQTTRADITSVNVDHELAHA